MQTNKFRILIVDDVPLNIKVVGKILKEKGYDVAFANSGKEALQKVSLFDYDLILLDIMMPEMDGYEVCRFLKKNEKSCEIPVIFLTAKTDIDSVLEGFNAGAVDYISKPFSSTELLARVKTHLELKSQRKIIESMNQILEKKVNERTMQLQEANKRLLNFDKTKSDFISLINHELRTPLMGMKGFVELLEKTLQTHKQIDYITSLKTQITQFEKITESALLITSIKADKYKMNLVKTPVTEIFECIKTQLKSILKKKPVNIIFKSPGKDILISVDLKIFTICLSNILSNAINASKMKDDIYCSAEINDNMIIFKISDDGPGFSEIAQKKLFEYFSNSDINHHKEGIGLGLAISKIIAETHGGKIEIGNKPDGGALVKIIIPTGV